MIKKGSRYLDENNFRYLTVIATDVNSKVFTCIQEELDLSGDNLIETGHVLMTERELNHFIEL